MARQALVRGINTHDTHVQAKASLVLGQAYVFESRFHLAHQQCSRAVELFNKHSDAAGQAEALSVVSYSASALGKDAEALRAASDGIALGASTESHVVRAAGLNYHGVASFWAGDFSTASGVLESSMWFAKNESKDAERLCQPLVNYCFCEVLRLTKGGRSDWSRGNISTLANAISRAQAMKQEGHFGGLTPGASEIGLLLLDFESCFLASQLGWLEDADAYYLACLDRASRLPSNSWLQSIALWARFERAKAYRDIGKSIDSARAMAMSAQAGEHAPLEALAHSLEESLRTQ